MSPGAGASAAPRPAATPSAAALGGFVCRSAASAAPREISVTAVMRPLAAPQRLAVRATLVRRDATGVRTVPGGRLERWIMPDDPTLGQRAADVWQVRLPVTGLTAPARYRLRVAFRWSDARGRVVATATRWSRACEQRRGSGQGSAAS